MPDKSEAYPLFSVTYGWIAEMFALNEKFNVSASFGLGFETGGGQGRVDESRLGDAGSRLGRRGPTLEA